MGVYEKQADVELHLVEMFNPTARAELGKLSPFGKVPLLVLDDGSALPESSIILEYIDTHCTTGTRLIPTDPAVALRARLYDRWFDLHLIDPMAIIFHNIRRPPDQRDEGAIATARATLSRFYAQLDEHFAKNQWAAGDEFTIAECAASPGLRYCAMVHPFESHKNLTAYWKRLIDRPSYTKITAGAAPFLAKIPDH